MRSATIAITFDQYMGRCLVKTVRVWMFVINRFVCVRINAASFHDNRCKFRSAKSVDTIAINHVLSVFTGSTVLAL